MLIALILATSGQEKRKPEEKRRPLSEVIKEWEKNPRGKITLYYSPTRKRKVISLKTYLRKEVRNYE